MHPSGRLLLLILFLTAILGLRTAGVHVRAASQPEDTGPNAACAPCHKEIYDRYRLTPMANASGAAVDGFIPGDFLHSASGVHYTVSEDAGSVWLSYERPGNSRPLHGRQRLIYYLGSGKRGRTYLFEQQGYWFESPINWYARKQLWDMAPAFQNAQSMPLTLPVDPGCLHCHTSSPASSLPGARNRFAAAPFASGGITCETCHGNADAHLASGGKIRLLSISTLEPVRRDSICLNCHLEGQAAVDREGKHAEDFRPGDNLFDYSVFFVHKAETGSGGRATSQWEALLRSRCKQASGDRLTCTTCHDPHGGPAPDQRVAWYRQKCLQCHDHAGFAERHHPNNPDCTECHMGRPPSNDIAHEQVTDHWIRKRATGSALPPATQGDLVPVGGVAAGDRELGLAYAQLAVAGDAEAAHRALDLLRKAVREGASARDAEVHARLGFLEQVNGRSAEAAAEYRLALEEDPFDSLAAGNLALIQAANHHAADAASLWREVLQHDPAEQGAGLNLAVVQCGTGEPGAALETLDRVLEFSPDNDRAREMARLIRTGSQECRSR